MRLLIDHQAFSSVSHKLSEIAREISRIKAPILVNAEPTLNGALSMAPIEAALLDSRMPYKRRFSYSQPEYNPSLRIFDGPEENPIINTDEIGFSISTTTVEGLRGLHGDSRKGPLSTVAQAHVLGQELSPSSKRLRRMRPWVLSGNWISDSFDNSYDPVYSSLRDFLSTEGSISVVPVTEVKFPDEINYPWLSQGDIEDASRDWESMGQGQREEVMDRLALPSMSSNHPSTSRIEELLWHCIVGTNWNSDLASQVSKARKIMEKKSPKEGASCIADLLVSQGIL